MFEVATVINNEVQMENEIGRVREVSQFGSNRNGKQISKETQLLS